MKKKRKNEGHTSSARTPVDQKAKKAVSTSYVFRFLRAAVAKK